MKPSLEITLQYISSLADKHRLFNKKLTKKPIYAMRAIIYKTKFRMNERNIKKTARIMSEMVSFLRENLKKQYSDIL